MWRNAIIPECLRLRQEDHEFKGYIARVYTRYGGVGSRTAMNMKFDSPGGGNLTPEGRFKGEPEIQESSSRSQEHPGGSGTRL